MVQFRKAGVALLLLAHVGGCDLLLPFSTVSGGPEQPSDGTSVGRTDFAEDHGPPADCPVFVQDTNGPRDRGVTLPDTDGPRDHGVTLPDTDGPRDHGVTLPDTDGPRDRGPIPVDSGADHAASRDAALPADVARPADRTLLLDGPPLLADRGQKDSLRPPDQTAAVTPDQPASLYAGWLYQMAISITSTATTALSNIQLQLVLDTAPLVTAGKLRADCADLRFADSVAVSYWIESGCNTSTTAIWIRLPLLPLPPAKRVVTLFYGNPSAASESAGQAVFDVFDDFSAAKLDSTRWTDFNPNSWGTMKVTAGVLTISGGTSGGIQVGRGIIWKQPIPFQCHIIELANRWTFLNNTSSGDYVHKVVQLSDVPAPACAECGDLYEWDFQWARGTLGVHTGNYRFIIMSGGAWTSVVEKGAQKAKVSAFEQERYLWCNGTQVSACNSTDGGQTQQQLWSKPSGFWTLPLSRYVGFVLENRSAQTQSAELDWIRVRQHLPANPTVSCTICGASTQNLGCP